MTDNAVLLPGTLDLLILKAVSMGNGSCQPAGLEVSIWYVGYVEKADGVWYFALQMGM